MSEPSPDPTAAADRSTAAAAPGVPPLGQAVIRYLDVDGVRLRTSTRGTGRPLLISAASVPGWNWPNRSNGKSSPTASRSSVSTPPGSANPPATGGRGGSPGSPGPSNGCSTPSATNRSTSSGCPWAGSSPNNSPTRHPAGCAGWCWPPPGPAYPGWAGYPAHHAPCWPWRPAAATSHRSTTGGSPATCTAAPPAPTPTRYCTAPWPGSPQHPPCALPRPALRHQLLDRAAVAATAPTPHPGPGR